MPQTEDIVRVKHMLDAAQKALEFSSGADRNVLGDDEKLALSLVRLLEVIGEAANNVSNDFQEKFPEIPWRQIGATRNRLIHGYFDVDLDVVWEIVSVDLPNLVPQLEKIIS
jgi:uncharacterized protein with HEPN domain